MREALFVQYAGCWRLTWGFPICRGEVCHSKRIVNAGLCTVECLAMESKESLKHSSAARLPFSVTSNHVYTAQQSAASFKWTCL